MEKDDFLTVLLLVPLSQTQPGDCPKKKKSVRIQIGPWNPNLSAKHLAVLISWQVLLFTDWIQKDAGFELSQGLMVRGNTSVWEQTLTQHQRSSSGEFLLFTTSVSINLPLCLLHLFHQCRLSIFIPDFPLLPWDGDQVKQCPLQFWLHCNSYIT